jgi:hypothetical protein
MTTVIPILRYRDPSAAVIWLQEAFGFTQHFVAEASQQVVHAQMRFGDALIMLGPEHDDDRYGMHSPMTLNGTNQCVYIVETGVWIMRVPAPEKPGRLSSLNLMTRHTVHANSHAATSRVTSGASDHMLASR